MARDVRVELGDGRIELGLKAPIGGLGRPRVIQYAFTGDQGQCGATRLEPVPMRANAPDECIARGEDVSAQLSPFGHGVRIPKDMCGRPAL